MLSTTPTSKTRSLPDWSISSSICYLLNSISFTEISLLTFATDMDPNNNQRSPSFPRVFKYDVFISFRGPDTRDHFVDHLYNHLIRKGIFVFKDDETLEKGEFVSSQLEQAIKGSRISLVVFSRTYADSKWCLDEMAIIAECRRESEQKVFPIFYDVDPSHVRNQNGEYKNAFDSHAGEFQENPGKVDLWRTAMKELGNLAGWVITGKVYAIIEDIIQKVKDALRHKLSGLADDLIGIQSHVEELEKLLKLSRQDDSRQVLGIWGMGGIGKTTHAIVLYNEISYQFRACCFIRDVNKIYETGGAVAVQKEILLQTLHEKNLDTYSPSEIRNRLCNIKVLVVLDNVNDSEQFEKLKIGPEDLGAGSRIIITTRDEHILKVCGACEVYNVPLMSNADARKLFRSKAFKKFCPPNNCEELIPDILKFAQGLPLAIEVLGSFLGPRDDTQWKEALKQLGRDDAHDKIMVALQLSYEGLSNKQKEIFLHIACFFNGEREDYVTRVLDCCQLGPGIGIPVIIERSLITIRSGEIYMHKMLEQLGKNIVQRHFPTKPGSWSRLWLYEDFHHAMISQTGTNNIEAIVLDQKADISKYSKLKAEEFSRMKSLKLLILHHQNFSGNLNFLSNSLHYLTWHGYQFTSLPPNFEPNRLVELNMPNSNVNRLWEGTKHLPCLQRMDLSNSKYLLETPNFEWSPNIVRLDFTGCTNLQHVHPSIGLLEQLAFLSFRNCSNLVSLDLGTNYKLLSMKVLHLSGCTKLKNTPDFSGLLNLEYLDLEQCSSLSAVHDSIGALESLKFLSLRGCKELCIIPRQAYNLRSLITLDLHGCVKLIDRLQSMDSDCFSSLIILDLGFSNLSFLPSAFRELRCLERLNLEGNNLLSVPHAIDQLCSLAYLNVSHCKKLKYCPVITPTSASSVGKYFKSVSGSRNHRSGFYAFNCPNMGYGSLSDLESAATSWIRRLLKEPSHFRGGFDIIVSGTEIPAWFEHQFDPGSAIRIVHSDVNDNWNGFAFYVAFDISYGSPNSGSSDNSFSSQQTHPLYLSFEGEHVEECCHMPLRLELDQIQGSKQEHLWFIYISRRHCHFVKTRAHITFKAHSGLNIRKWGLFPVFNSTNLYSIFRERSRMKRLKRDNELNDEANQVNCPPFVYASESYNSSAGPKIQLPYNWLVSEEEENEKMEAEQKENRFSNVGL